MENLKKVAMILVSIVCLLILITAITYGTKVQQIKSDARQKARIEAREEAESAAWLTHCYANKALYQDKTGSLTCFHGRGKEEFLRDVYYAK